MKNIIGLLVTIVIFFATLDGLRDTFLADNPISYVKEMSAISLFFLLMLIAVRRKVAIKKMNIIVFNICFMFLLMISFLTTKYADISFSRANLGFGGWSVWIKFLSLYCIMNSLFLLKILYPRFYYKIPNIYIYFTILYSLITIFFIVSGFSSLLPSRNWAGRLSIGYPTMDSFVLVVAIIFTIFFMNNRIAKVLVIILFLVVLIMQNTATGYIMLAVLGGMFVFTLKGLKKAIPLALTIPVIYSGYIVYNSLWVYMGTFGTLFVDKINGFLFGADTSSIELRRMQISTLTNDMNKFLIYKIFGKGGNEAYLVESTYYAIYGFSGLAGIILLIFSLCYFLLKLPASFKAKTYYCHSFFILLVFIVSSAGLIGFYLFPLLFIYGYLVSVYCFREVEHIDKFGVHL